MGDTHIHSPDGGRWREALQAWPLKVKIALFAMVVFVAGIGGLAAYVVHGLERDFRNLIDHEQTSAANVLARTLNNHLRLRLDLLGFMAGELATLPREDPQAMARYLARQGAATRVFTRDLYILSPEGVRIAELPERGTLGTPYHESSYFQDVLASRQPLVRTWFGRFAQKPVLLVAVPILTAEGQLLGVLCATELIESDSQFNFTGQMHNGQQGGFHVYAPKERIFAASSDPSRVLQPLPAPGVNPLLDQRLAGYYGPGQVVDSKGMEIFSAAALVPVSGWVVAAYIPVEEAFAPLQTATHQVYAGALVVAALAGLLIWLGLRHSLRPLERAARTLGSGDGPPRLRPLPVEGSHEIRLLALSFNQLQREVATQAALIRDERDHLEQEVSERTRQLAERTEELQAIFDSAPVGMALLQQRHVVRCNRKLEELFLCPPGSLVGQPTRPWYVSEEEYVTVGRELYEQVRREGLDRRNQRFQRADGNVFWARVSSRFLSTVDANSPLLAIIEDATLEHQAAEQLALARDQAEANSRAKSSFLANMSHEIRTPLNAILGLAYLARRREADEEQRERLVKITQSGEHLLAILNDILDFSKIEAGMMTLEQRPVDLKTLAGNIVSMLSETARAKGLQLRVEMDAMPHGVVGDITRLTQAFLNLANNAVKFTEQGSVTLRTLLEGESGTHLQVRFEVTDTGRGVAAEQVGRLFAPFQQADSSTTREFGGTGLGLAITRRLAQLMGGTAGVETQAGQGSTFWFTANLEKGLPALSGSSYPEGGGHEPLEWEISRRFPQIPVLLVEDDPINQEVGRAFLEEAGCQVSLADDGEVAVERVRAGLASTGEVPYALIFMDMQMPHLDGVDATRAIRRLPGTAETPIIAMTANAFSEDRARCIEAGMDDFLSKPVEPERLYHLMLYWLAQHPPKKTPVK